MRPTLRQFGVIVGFVLVSLLLVSNALITKHRLDVQESNAQWVLHSDQVLIALTEAESTLKDAETGQRGYLLTGDALYEAPYNRALQEINPQLDNITSMTADNPRQQANMARLRPLAAEKMSELADTVTQYRSGNVDEAKALVMTDRGLIVMDQIRLLFAQMRQEETRLDTQREAEYRRSLRMTTLSIWLASIMAIVGLIVLAFFILRERELREKHGDELRVSEEWFRVTLGSIGDAVIATDQNGNVTFLNEIAARLTGVSASDARGRHIHHIFPIFSEITGKDAEDPVKKVMESGVVVGLANHTVLKHKDGSLTPIEDSAAPIWNDKGDLIGVVLVFRDVTTERNTQDVLRKTEKLAAAARLSATVAHEINNPLAAVVNLVFIAKMTPNMPEAAVQHLTVAEQELDRIAHITRQALGFYRESAAPEPIDLASLMDAVLKLYLNKIAAKSIRIERRFEVCPPVLAVSGELRQAASNLIANAIDAVEHGGSIIVGARRAAVSKSCEVEATVADDGPGIPTENVDRIFEPFFTTKKDVGTGLGLWAAKTIVERHGGSLTVVSSKSTPGQCGTIFRMCIPCAPASPEK